jgi:hypothetical protein
MGTLFAALIFLLSQVSLAADAQNSLPAITSISVDPGSPPIAFRPEWRVYQVEVSQSVTAVRINVTAGDPKTVLTVGEKPAASGTPSGPVDVETGRNMIPVVASSSDGAALERYMVKVIRRYPAPEWVRVREDSPWPPRDSAGELVFGNRMWLFGGYTPKVVNDIWASDDGAKWVRAGEMPDSTGVNIPINLVYDGKMWVVCNDGSLFSSSDGASWRLVSDDAPWKGRYAAGGAVFRDRMWVMGGMKKGEVFHDVWSSADGVRWTREVEEAPWSRRQLFSMVSVFGDRLWVIGGGITMYHPFRAYSDVWSSPDGKKWTCVTEQAPWPPRIWSSSAVYRNRLWVIGGFRAEPTWNNFNDAWYSSNGKNWSELKSGNVWNPRHELSVFVFDDRLWVVGGNSWPLMNDVWYLDIKGMTFVTQPVIEEFASARYRYQARADFNRSGEAVRYRLLEGPRWMRIDRDTGILSGTPDAAGDATVSIEAYDNAGETARQTFTLHVMTL